MAARIGEDVTPPLLSALISLVALSACDSFAPPVSSEAVDYRPEVAGTVDHAMCLLGFTATPLDRLVTGHQLVDGTLNGKPASFLLDTGANVSVVDVKHSGHFGLVEQRGVFGAAAGLGGTLKASRASIDSLELGALDINQRQMMVSDLGQIEAMLGRVSTSPIHGIIGQDVMRKHHAIIDVERPMLYMLKARAAPSPVPAERCDAPPDIKRGPMTGASPAS